MIVVHLPNWLMPKHNSASDLTYKFINVTLNIYEINGVEKQMYIYLKLLLQLEHEF